MLPWCVQFLTLYTHNNIYITGFTCFLLMTIYICISLFLNFTLRKFIPQKTKNQSFLKHYIVRHIRKLNNLGTVFIFPMLAGLDPCAFWGRLMRPRVVSKMFKWPVCHGHWPFRRDSNKRAGGGPQDLLLTRP